MPRLARVAGRGARPGRRRARRPRGPTSAGTARACPGGLVGADIPMASRIAHLAEFLEVAAPHRRRSRRRSRWAGAVPAPSSTPPWSTLVEARRREGLPPARRAGLLGRGDRRRAGAGAHAAQPERVRRGAGRDRPLRRPEVAVHPGPLRAVATLAAAAGRRARPARRGRSSSLHRAGLVAGFGRLGVSNAIWDKPGPLSAAEWERVRLYPHVHRADAAPVPGAGSRRAGSPARSPSASTAPATRAGWPGSALSLPSRILATAELSRPSASRDRTGRRSRSPRRRRCCVTRCAPAGSTATVVDAVLRAAGERVQPAPGRPGRPHRPGGRGAASAWSGACRTRRSRRRW